MFQNGFSGIVGELIQGDICTKMKLQNRSQSLILIALIFFSEIQGLNASALAK